MPIGAERTTDPWVESPWIEADIGERKLSPELAALARRYHSEGFAVVPGLIDHDLIVRILDDLTEPLTGQGRVQDAWKFSAAVRQLATTPQVLDLLRTLYGREPVPFQTLNFQFGTQQRAHSDTVHFSSLPRRYMCGVWVALEDVDVGNGPLFYYPGSQGLPDPYFQRFGRRPRELRPLRGGPGGAARGSLDGADRVPREGRRRADLVGEPRAWWKADR